MSSQELKKNIIKDLDRLPIESLAEVNDFVSYILSRSYQGSEEFDIVKDPLAEYIGSINHGSLASGIDDELYGEKT